MPSYGEQLLEPGAGRGELVYVPRGYRPDRPAPLALMLHGAGGTAEHGLSLLRSLADDAGLLLLATKAREPTWDVIMSAYGPDVEAIDSALGHALARYAVEPMRIAIGGFSDGASYALSLGLINGDLFTHVIAFSPCFAAARADRRGRPRLFIAHGTRDEVLPVASCSRRLVPELKLAGYDVRYREFDGPHTVPPAIAREAVTWFVQGPAEAG
ncbi:serine esterase, putative [Minicystis rosea]|nr:serine esterase, putative [Minicystis rosea]